MMPQRGSTRYFSCKTLVNQAFLLRRSWSKPCDWRFLQALSDRENTRRNSMRPIKRLASQGIRTHVLMTTMSFPVERRWTFRAQLVRLCKCASSFRIPTAHFRAQLEASLCLGKPCKVGGLCSTRAVLRYIYSRMSMFTWFNANNKTWTSRHIGQKCMALDVIHAILSSFELSQILRKTHAEREHDNRWFHKLPVVN